MKIGTIGAGHVAQALARLAVQHGHEVMLSRSGEPASLESVAKEIGCQAGNVGQAMEFGELIIIAIPFKAYTDLSKAGLADKIVIDASNYFDARDGQIDGVVDRMTATSELVSSHLSLSRVVKAFNAIPMTEIARDARAAGAPDRRALPVAGNDIAAKQRVMQLTNEFGFDALDAGTLADSWRFQPGTPVFCVFFDRPGLASTLEATPRG